MEAWPEFRPSRLLAALVMEDVDFVVIGGYAAIAHGSARHTNDLDVSYSPDPANLERLGRALVGLEARLRGVAEEVPFVPDARALHQVQLLTLDTREGPLDLLAAPGGGPGWAQLRAGAVRTELGDIEILVASIDHLLAMKRAAGRPKDLVDIEELEAIRRLSGG